MLFAVLLAANATTTIPTGPSGAAFYAPPSPLPVQVDGHVIWARPFTGGAALPSAAANYRVLYETVGPSGAFVAVSGTVAIPKGTPPAQGWPVISWAHGTSGNAPQCAPSRFAHMDIEQTMMDGFVRRGYAVVQTDYEGNGTPGIHPYFVAAQSAHDVADIVVAARNLDPNIGRNWIAMGHSEGGAAALSTAALGEAWEPDLHLLGAVAYAPGSHYEGMLQNSMLDGTPNEGLAFLALLIDGYSTVDPRVVPSQILESDALQLMPLLNERCIDDLAANTGWARIVPETIFRPNANVDALYHDLLANDPENMKITLPVLLVQGVADEEIPSEMTIDVRDRLCRAGTPITFRTYPGATHATVLTQADGDVAAWVAQRFAGVPPASNC
jgi:pimeloyl-ACP methyl ester carboxylesterase